MRRATLPVLVRFAVRPKAFGHLGHPCAPAQASLVTIRSAPIKGLSRSSLCITSLRACTHDDFRSGVSDSRTVKRCASEWLVAALLGPGTLSRPSLPSPEGESSAAASGTPGSSGASQTGWSEMVAAGFDTLSVRRPSGLPRSPHLIACRRRSELAIPSLRRGPGASSRSPILYGRKRQGFQSLKGCFCLWITGISCVSSEFRGHDGRIAGPLPRAKPIRKSRVTGLMGDSSGLPKCSARPTCHP